MKKEEEEEEEEFDERMMVEEEEEEQTHVFKRGSVKGEKVKKLSRRSSNHLKNPILNTSGDELYLVSYPSLFDELIQEVFILNCYIFDVCFDFGRVS